MAWQVWEDFANQKVSWKIFCSEVKGKIYGGVLIKIQLKMLIFNGFGRKWALVCFQLSSCSLEILYPKICSL